MSHRIDGILYTEAELRRIRRNREKAKANYQRRFGQKYDPTPRLWPYAPKIEARP